MISLTCIEGVRVSQLVMHNCLLLTLAAFLSFLVTVCDATPSSVFGRSSSSKVGDLGVLEAERAVQNAERGHHGLMQEGHEIIQALADSRMETIRLAKKLATAGYPVIPGLSISQPMDTTSFAEAITAFNNLHTSYVDYKRRLATHHSVLTGTSKALKATQADIIQKQFVVVDQWAANEPKDEDGAALLHELQLYRITKADERRLADVLRYERMISSIVHGLRRLKLEWR